MKLVVHLTADNVDADEAERIYLDILEKFKDDKRIHVNGQAVDKYVGSHHTGLPGPPGEI